MAPSEDLDRVLRLPRRTSAPPSDTTTTVYRRKNPSCTCAKRGRDCITQLRPVQSWALKEIASQGGLLGPIGVGHGKTALDILTPLAMPGCKVAVLLVPPNLRSQLIKEYELIGQHFDTPSLVVHGEDYTKTHPGRPVLHVFPYSLLSSPLPERREFLQTAQPDTVIADECHYLRNATAARTMRFLRYFGTNPDTRFCGWSGSLSDKSIKDYAHLAELALGVGSPLPIASDTLDEWAKALDPDPNPAPPGALMELCHPGEPVHEGVRRRVCETYGVVSATEPASAARLTIRTRDPGKLPGVIRSALAELRATWTRPDGEELVDALALAKSARELACGFYYRWIFPRGESVYLIMRWLKARKEWNREVRQLIKQRLEHLDSPKLVENAAKRGCGDLPRNELPALASNTWPAWRDVAKLVQPETEAVRLSDYLVQDAARWAAENRGIVWTAHREFGQWVAESSGLPFHGGGPKAGELIALERGDRSIVASIQAHGTGRDGLQRLFATQLIATPPSSPTAWEQTLGRLHRVGQKSAQVTAEFYKHTPELRSCVETAVLRAEKNTLGANKKIITAGI